MIYAQFFHRYICILLSILNTQCAIENRAKSSISRILQLKTRCKPEKNPPNMDFKSRAVIGQSLGECSQSEWTGNLAAKSINIILLHYGNI